ncbi:GNAT family N-acetyltransferase [Pseudoxanthomonas daejeonensis]|uniref:GNAT family N-acetyltransferase n=1 Tax=Pseudoxanthomonas daejeonensis TaxID=266062 RepID=UPI001F53EC1E|nr:GNAT family N-acetyltransferase [Pseudoxanthomonas daejeonensis]UNK57747.1 GNAT family N-acetyltransferase [Pseudoxanthomonas daejeonensis]
MIIRNFMPGEEEALRGVFVSSVHDLAAKFYTPEQINAWAPIAYDRQEWASKLARLRPFVAVSEGQVVGYADLQGPGYIDHFFVSGRFAGRGVGNALMGHICGVAARRGISELSADVSLSAEPFFSKHGFVVVERQTVAVAGVELANARMCKALRHQMR